MYRRGAALAALLLLLTGCGSTTPVAKPPSPPTPTETTTAPTTTSTTSSVPQPPAPPTPPTTNVKDCFEANCVLLVTQPMTIRLDARKLHYSAMTVTAISTDSLSYSVDYPQGGGSSATVGVGLGGSSFGFTGSPMIQVGLTLVDGRPALVLQTDT